MQVENNNNFEKYNHQITYLEWQHYHQLPVTAMIYNFIPALHLNQSQFITQR